MAMPDFIQLHCVNNDSDACSHCNRDFIIPITTIEGAYKTADNKTDLCIKSSHYVVDPRCLSAGGKVGNRIIKLSMSWTDFIDELDGRISNCGNVEMITP